VRRRLATHRDVGRAARELVDKAIDLGSIDNVSALVVAFQPMPIAAALAASGAGGGGSRALPHLPSAIVPGPAAGSGSEPTEAFVSSL
jgi:hypothetical protein